MAADRRDRPLQRTSCLCLSLVLAFEAACLMTPTAARAAESEPAATRTIVGADPSGGSPAQSRASAEPGRSARPADIPSPGTSTCPTSVIVGSAGVCCFDVVVRGPAGLPIVGSSVVVDFSACPFVLSSVQREGLVVDPVHNTIRTMTDVTGTASFCIRASGDLGLPCAAIVFADGVRLCTLPVNACGSDGTLLDFSFAQLDIEHQGELIENSESAMFDLRYEPGASEAYVNVAARLPGQTSGYWVVRNLYLPDASRGAPLEQIATRFPLASLGVQTGQDVPAIEYALEITGWPWPDPDAAAWLAALSWLGPLPVTSPTSGTGAGGEVWPLPYFDSILGPAAPGFYIPHPPTGLTATRSWIGCRMPNIDLDGSTHPMDWNGCAPASVANSMRWLDDVHNEITIPANLREAFEQLSQLMYRTNQYDSTRNTYVPTGATVTQVLRAKLDFIEAHQLPIHVKYQARWIDESSVASTTGLTHAESHDASEGSYPTNIWMQNEASRGEDVELGGTFAIFDSTARRWISRGAHAITLTGAGTTLGGPWIEFKHDTLQNRPGGTCQQFSHIDTTRVPGVMLVPGLSHRDRDGNEVCFFIHRVYSESYDPEVPSIPTLHQFREFCHLTYRTLPPNGVLEFAFPSDDRSYNVTIYDLERHTGGGVWRKKHVWNQNSGLTRRYVNTSDSCVTIKIHNDDDHRVLGEPIFWNLGLTMATSASGDSTSPSNVGDYGGFSLGGTDSSSSEFGSPPGPSVTLDASPGCSLSDVPGRLGAGVGQLTLTHPIPVWHPTWARVALKLSVAGVTSPGELLVTCPTSGFSGAQAIGARGQYVVDLGVVPNSTQFEITLAAQSGLDFDVDAIGIVPISTSGADAGGVEAAPLLAMTHLGANPIRGHGQVRLDLPTRQQVDLAVFDLMGRKVASLASGVMKAGSHVISWSGRDDHGALVPNGLYFCHLRAAAASRAIRWVMLR